MLHLVSGINSLYLFVILVPVPLLPTHLLLHLDYHFFLFCFTTLLIHNFLSLFHSRLKPTCFTNPIPTPVVFLLPPGLPSPTFACTVSSELCFYFFKFLADVNSRSRSLYAIADPSVVCRLSVVCLWRWCALLSRLKFSAIFFHHTIAQGL